MTFYMAPLARQDEFYVPEAEEDAAEMDVSATSSVDTTPSTENEIAIAESDDGIKEQLVAEGTSCHQECLNGLEMTSSNIKAKADSTFVMDSSGERSLTPQTTGKVQDQGITSTSEAIVLSKSDRIAESSNKPSEQKGSDMPTQIEVGSDSETGTTSSFEELTLDEDQVH